MPEPVQLDLFAVTELDPKVLRQESMKPAPLNGMYYEQSTGRFVSYVLGCRYFEITPCRCLGDKAWKEKTMRERAI